MSQRLAGADSAEALRLGLIKDVRSLAPEILQHTGAEALWPAFFSGCVTVESSLPDGRRAVAMVNLLADDSVVFAFSQPRGWAVVSMKAGNPSEFVDVWMRGVIPVETVLKRRASALGGAHAVLQTAPEVPSVSENPVWLAEAGEILGRVAVMAASLTRWRDAAPVAADSLARQMQLMVNRTLPAQSPLASLLPPADQKRVSELPDEIVGGFRPLAWVNGTRKTLVMGSVVDPSRFVVLSSSASGIPPVQRASLVFPDSPEMHSPELPGADNFDRRVDQAIAAVGEKLEQRLTVVGEKVAPLVRSAGAQLTLESVWNREAVAAADRAMFATALFVGLRAGFGNPSMGRELFPMHASPRRSERVAGFSVLRTPSDPTDWIRWYQWRSTATSEPPR